MKPLIFTYALTYGGAVVSLIKPWYGFLIYVAFGIIKPDALWFWAIPQGNYSRTVAIAFLLGWFLNGTGDWRFGRGWLIVGCLVVYFLTMVLTSSIAAVPDTAWAQVEPMAKVLLPVIAGATLIDSIEKLKQMAWVIVVCQGYLAYEFNLFYLQAPYFEKQMLVHGGLDNNGVAITMVTSVGLAFFLGIHAPKRWQQLLALGCAAMMAHVVLFSESRGGMVAMIITGVFTFVLIPKKLSYYLVLGFAAAGVLFFAGEGVQKRFMTMFQNDEEGVDSKGGGRLDFWKGCLKSMGDNPIGVGPNHWVVVAPNYGLPPRPAHSTWMQAGAEVGVLGLASLLGYYLVTMWRLYPFTKDRRSVADPWFRYLARAVICALVGFLASAQFVTVDGVELPYYIALIGIGVLKLSSAQEALAVGFETSSAAPSVPGKL